MRALHKATNRAILKPFLLQDLVADARLGELFACIDSYLETTSTAALRSYEIAREQLETYSLAAESFATTYSVAYLRKLVERLDGLLSKHFEQSELSGSGQLEVAQLEKKYPFHRAGAAFGVRVGIRNVGRGHAFNVRTICIAAEDNTIIEKPDLYLGDIAPTQSIEIDIPITLINPASQAGLVIDATWTNFDSTEQHTLYEPRFTGQRTDVDWDMLGLEEPYSLEPVETENELIGRKEILGALVRSARTRNITSSYVYGQKRVGKTSVVRVLKDRLQRTLPGQFIVLYLQAGDFVDPDASVTIQRLGERICEEV